MPVRIEILLESIHNTSFSVSKFLLLLHLDSEFEETNNAITNAIFSNDCHIREHLAGIIGEKRLYSAKEALCSQLQAEENFYTAVSIIEAIG